LSEKSISGFPFLLSSQVKVCVYVRDGSWMIHRLALIIRDSDSNVEEMSRAHSVVA
jgi:hypothetical protein